MIALREKVSSHDAIQYSNIFLLFSLVQLTFLRFRLEKTQRSEQLNRFIFQATADNNNVFGFGKRLNHQFQYKNARKKKQITLKEFYLCILRTSSHQ